MQKKKVVVHSYVELLLICCHTNILILDLLQIHITEESLRKVVDLTQAHD